MKRKEWPWVEIHARAQCVTADASSGYLAESPEDDPEWQVEQLTGAAAKREYKAALKLVAAEHKRCNDEPEEVRMRFWVETVIHL